MRAVAFVFKRKGQRELTALEFKHAVSLDLRWFAPSDALRFYQAAVRRGFVREEGERVIVLVRQKGRTIHGGVEVPSSPSAAVVTVREGRLAGAAFYLDRTQAARDEGFELP